MVWVMPSTRPRLIAQGSLCSIACNEPPPAATALPSLSSVDFGSTVLSDLPSSKAMYLRAVIMVSGAVISRGSISNTSDSASSNARSISAGIG